MNFSLLHTLTLRSSPYTRSHLRSQRRNYFRASRLRSPPSSPASLYKYGDSHGQIGILCRSYLFSQVSDRFSPLWQGLFVFAWRRGISYAFALDISEFFLIPYPQCDFFLHQIWHFPTSLGVSKWASEQTNERSEVQKQSKRMSECKQTNEQTSEWLSTRVPIFGCSDLPCNPFY